MVKAKSKTSRGRRWGSLASLVILALVVSLTAAPEVLAWPYRADRGAVRIYSEVPIPGEMDQVLARADRLLAQSPVHDAQAPRRLFLTQGGWRWNLLALTSRNAFALRRPLRSAIVFNRSDVAADRITRSAEIGGVRSLSGVIAHEITHVNVAAHLGELQARMLPTWKSEGYADHVAQESSLTAAQAAQLRAAGADHPALPYFEGRQRVAQILEENGGNADAMLRAD